MRSNVFLVFDKHRVLRMTRGKDPPSLRAGERFVAVCIEAPDSIWTPAKVEVQKVVVPEGAAIAPPVRLDLATIPGVCFGPILPRQDNKGWPAYRCVKCGFEGHSVNDAPHWKPEPKVVVQDG